MVAAVVVVVVVVLVVMVAAVVVVVVVEVLTGRIPLLKPNSRKKGTRIIKGLP